MRTPARASHGRAPAAAYRSSGPLRSSPCECRWWWRTAAGACRSWSVPPENTRRVSYSVLRALFTSPHFQGEVAALLRGGRERLFTTALLELLTPTSSQAGRG